MAYTVLMNMAFQQGSRKTGPPYNSKIIDTLPKRIFGRPCGLLHQRLLKDLLAVDFFFKRPTSDEAVYHNSLLLSNAINSVYKTTRVVTVFATFFGKSSASFEIK